MKFRPVDGRRLQTKCLGERLDTEPNGFNIGSRKELRLEVVHHQSFSRDNKLWMGSENTPALMTIGRTPPDGKSRMVG